MSSRTLTTSLSLNVQAEDANGGSSELVIPVRLCICMNGGTCLYGETIDEVDSFEVNIFLLSHCLHS